MKMNKPPRSKIFGKRRRLYRFVLPILLLLFAAGTASAQTAQVTGIVTDAASAAVPNAEVTVTNIGTGIDRKVVTNEEGTYTIPFLRPDIYRITVRASGFGPVTREGVSLSVEQVARLDFTLQVGAITEQEVTITADTPVLEKETSSQGQVLTNRTIVTLPLNGRNYTQLAVLAPGAAPNRGSRAEDGFSVNGNRTFQNSFLIDGIDNNNYILGVDTNSTQALRPSIDAIQEFKVETANYSAEYGRAAGGVVNVVIKSGTNDFHGSVFEFLRNDALDANDFFANRSGLERPPLRYNQFGGTVGGPIILPRFGEGVPSVYSGRNRTFFFASYQGTRNRRSETVITTVPTPGMVQGDFGGINIYDPRSVVNGIRQQFPNNHIPEDRIDAVGRRLAALYPVPNLSGLINNFASNIPRVDDADQLDFRVDHSFTASDTIFGRYSRSIRELVQGSIFNPPGNGGAGPQNRPSIDTPQAYSFAVGETHVFSPTIVNDLRVGFTNNKSDQNIPATESLYAEFGIRGVPQVAGLTGLPQIGMTGYTGLGDRAFAPNPKQVQVLQLNDNLSITRGNHTIRTGSDLRFTKNFAASSNNARGNISFNGQFTARVPGQSGNAIADLLLGQTSSAQLTTLLTGDFRDQYYGFYMNDNWKVTPRLTLNLGLRYEIQTPLVESDDRLANFDIDRTSPTFGTLVSATDGSLRSRGFVELDKNNLAPRVGFAYQVDPKTVLRGSFGIFYGGLGYQGIAQTGAANVPFFINVAFPSPTTAAASNLVLANGFPTDALDLRRAVNPAAFAYVTDNPLSEVYQGSLGVQRELIGNTVLSVAYVGSGSAHLTGLNDVNAPVPGPGAVQPRRRFPNFGGITVKSSFVHSTYHSLQAKAERRFSRGFSLLSSYTWSHSIDNSVDPEDTGNGPTLPQNPNNTAAEKASSAIDIRHRLVTSLIFDLPIGRVGGFLGESRIVRAMLGGFQIGGIFVAQSGPSFSLSVAPNPANTTTPARPDRLSDGSLPGDQRSIERWFDVAAFAPAAPFTFGNSGRNILRAPGLVNLDLLVARNFRFTESKRLELRGEFFNFTNTAHFGTPNAVINSPQAGQITNTSVPNRQIQLGLRFVF